MLTGLKRAVVVAGSAILLAASIPAGAVGAQGARLIPFVQVSPGGLAVGNITLHGVALNCATGQPASRVAIYDGADPAMPYVADGSMDTTVDLASVCGNRSGSIQAGFTVIFNSRLLHDGAHALVLAAEFPDGSSATGGSDLVIHNTLPYESQDTSSD